MMTKRNPLLVVALTFFTLTLYAYWWLYKTTSELKEETARDDLNPILDVFLAVITFGLWGLWATVRNARIVHREMEERGEEHTDRTLGVATFAALTVFSGWSWLVSMALLQEDLNRLGETEFAPEVDDFAAAPLRARVEVPPAAEPAPARDRWVDAPCAPVFRSNAPMPIVF